MRVSVEDFEQRKRFGRFTLEDAALLAELQPAFERHADEIVERFYDHLLGQPALRPFLSPPGTVERLKGSQRVYLLSLTSGRYDETHLRQRLAIGEVHDRIGLAPEWYVGTYGLYFDLLLPLVHDHFAPDSTRALRAEAALAKLIVLDMQLVLDSYHGLQRQRAVERSEQLAAVGELAASIAHEVRNPLAGMKGALQVLKSELSTSSQEVAGEILAQIDRLERLVRDLLTYARPSTLVRSRFDLHEMLDRLLRFHEDDPAMSFRRAYGPGTERLFADPEQMEQVFLNLIHNGVQAMPEGGTLGVTTRAGKRAIEIVFADEGRGIAAADLPRVFQPFFTTKHRGSGLGLPIVKKIVEAHGGALDIRSAVGSGTTVTVRIAVPGTAR